MRQESLSNNLEQTLAERAKTHGDFESFAKISQSLKNLVADSISGKKFNEFTDVQIEALDMICHKLARILNGNPHIHDHWHDIAGYATLVAKELEKNETR